MSYLLGNKDKNILFYLFSKRNKLLRYFGLNSMDQQLKYFGLNNRCAPIFRDNTSAINIAKTQFNIKG